jgi:hypothetical protein
MIRIYKVIDDVVEMDTLEGQEVYKAISVALLPFDPNYKKALKDPYFEVPHDG